MAYYRPGDRVGGYPIGAELGDDGPSGLRPAGGYGPQGYGVPSYEYERERPLGGPYVGGASEYYGAERPGGYGYEREGYGRGGFGREGLMREGYAPSVYDQGYPRQPQILVEPPVEYVEAPPSDLGMGLRDTGNVARRHPTDFGAGYGRPEVAGYGRPEMAGYGRSGMAGYGGAPGYGAGMYEEDEVRRLKKELEHERREKHELEVAAAGAVGYGLHERHEKKDAEDGDFEPKKEKKRHHFFSRD